MSKSAAVSKPGIDAPKKVEWDGQTRRLFRQTRPKILLALLVMTR